jgi:Co/Zn/Cd efflux system component
MMLKRVPSFAFWIGLALCLLGSALSVPPGRSLIEQSMAWHMVVQMPILFAGGWFLMIGARDLSKRSPNGWNQFGLTGFIAAQFILTYWMLPISIDRAVVMPQVDVLKLLSLIASGALIQTSVSRSPVVVQLFFVGYIVSMLISTGVFLATTERRLCNAYSMESQLSAGYGVVAFGVALACAWAFRVNRLNLKPDIT